MNGSSKGPIALLLSIFVFFHLSNAAGIESMRLVNGDTYYGRLEVLYAGVWGTVCDDDFSYSEAEVACRQLGLDTSLVDYYSNAHFGEGSGEIWLDSVTCGGYESDIDDCAHSEYGVHDCSHSEDVSISCGVSNLDSPVSTSSGSYNWYRNAGSWIGFVVFFVIIVVSASVYRRRRILHNQQSRTTTVIQPPTTTMISVPPPNPSSYGQGAPQTGPGSYPRAPQPYSAGVVYPPPAGPGVPPSNPYPVQAYPPPTQPQAQPGQYPIAPPSGPGVSPYPPQNPAAGAAPYPSPAAGAAPYPPPQAGQQAPYPPGGEAPPMYPPQGSAEPDVNLPPPPSYNDIVKQ